MLSGESFLGAWASDLARAQRTARLAWGNATSDPRLQRDRLGRLEVQSLTLPVAGSLFAEFAYAPATPANGKAVSFPGPISLRAERRRGRGRSAAGRANSERHPSHVYAAPGFYPVRLVVTNGAAARSKSSAIRVGPLWGHGGPWPRRALHGVPLTGTPHPVPRP